MRPLAVLLTLAGLLSANVAHAAENPNAAAQAKAVAPYLDGQSYAVVRFNLKQINVEVLYDHLGKVLPVPNHQRALEEIKKTDRTIAALREQKVGDIYMVVNIARLARQEEPLLIVPVGKGGNHHTVAALMFSQNADGPTSRKTAQEFGRPVGGSFELCTRLGDAVFCGTQSQFDSLKKLKPVPRPNLVKAFQAAGDAAFQAVVLPGADHRRVIGEMLPQLPRELGGGSGADLVDEIQWVAFGVSPPPQLAARLTVQSKNATAAKSLHRRAIAGLDMISRFPDVQKTFKPFDKIREMLTPKVEGNRLVLEIDAKGKKFNTLIGMFAIPVGQARAAAQRSSSRNNLKQIGIAMHNFHDTYKSFPPNASYDEKNKKLLSWRVFLLPYLEQQALFNEFRLNEPWDSDHNKKLIAKMPAVFADPASPASKAKGITRYLAPVGPSLTFTGKPEGIRIRDITDGTSNTILMVEAAPKQAIVWTKPDDLNVDLDKVIKGLVDEKTSGFQILLCDGSVRFVSKAINLKTLKAIFTRASGEIVGEF